MPKISKQRLQKIIAEELKTLKEDVSSGPVDHMAIKDVVAKAADLITAIAEFKEEATPAMLNAMTPHINNVEKALQNMVSTPGSYVTVAKKEPKKVSLRSTVVKDK